MTRAALVAALACAACDGGHGKKCDLDSVLDEDTFGIAVEDCGFVMLGNSAASSAARSCVMSALDEQRDFRVIFEVQGIDSYIVLGYASYDDQRFAYLYDSYGGASSHRSTCSDLVPVLPCDASELATSLCFMCTQQTLDSQCAE